MISSSIGASTTERLNMRSKSNVVAKLTGTAFAGPAQDMLPPKTLTKASISGYMKKATVAPRAAYLTTLRDKLPFSPISARVMPLLRSKQYRTTTTASVQILYTKILKINISLIPRVKAKLRGFIDKVGKIALKVRLVRRGAAQAKGNHLRLNLFSFICEILLP